ncbi:hypothetical protein, partial [Escherichia coli]|uniref:hypothetical protein n=1 Tax=Escherichia coli TaxID=562 RepID=UPI00273830F7
DVPHRAGAASLAASRARAEALAILGAVAGGRGGVAADGAALGKGVVADGALRGGRGGRAGGVVAVSTGSDRAGVAPAGLVGTG